MTREEFEARRAENDRRDKVLSAAVDYISELYLGDPELPEWHKVELRILRELKKSEELKKSIAEYAIPLMGEEKLKKLYPLRKEVLEYITLVNAGMEAFINEHPIPEDLK